MRFVLGVDEAGRGPLAGPVAVGAIIVPPRFSVAREFPGVADSKQLTPEVREELFARLLARVGRGDVRFAVEFESADTIDREGIVPAVRRALDRAVRALAPNPEGVVVKLDGALRAPPEYSQMTIIRGDELIPLISLASIAAKVSRDRLMKELSRVYPLYGFERHKGYGTDAHYDMLRTHGPCDIHRLSFIHLDAVSK